jgi:hypothetical protein
MDLHREQHLVLFSSQSAQDCLDEKLGIVTREAELGGTAKWYLSTCATIHDCIAIE